MRGWAHKIDEVKRMRSVLKLSPGVYREKKEALWDESNQFPNYEKLIYLEGEMSGECHRVVSLSIHFHYIKRT